MKIAPIIHAIEKANKPEKHIQYRLIHTGQHYDKNMNNTFFEQLEIPKPDVNLNVGRKREVDQYGKTHGISINTWKPEPKSASGEFNDSDLPF